MSYNNYYMRLRVKAVQEFDRMYHEPEYKAKCHKRVKKSSGCRKRNSKISCDHQRIKVRTEIVRYNRCSNLFLFR